MLAVIKISSQFRWSRHWAVTLSRWPCLLYPYISIGRGHKRTHDIVWKRVGDKSHWSGWVRWDHTSTGTEAAASGTFTCWIRMNEWMNNFIYRGWHITDIPSYLSGSSIIQPLAAREEIGTVVSFFFFSSSFFKYQLVYV